MIPATALDGQMPAWRRELVSAVTDPAVLIKLLELPPELLEPARLAARQFGLRVPRSYLDLMEPGNPHDPLLRQVLPIADEMRETPGFGDDPLDEQASTTAGGLVEKYQGRALLLASGHCALHCRYCFRRSFPYAGFNVAGRDAEEEALARLAERSDLQELILSGGDPLALDDGRLAQLVQRLDRIPHLRRLRIHTRLPIAIPSRVTDELCTLLTQTRLAPVLVVHCNHPQELAPDRTQALARLRTIGVTLFNQSVLLAGVNDNLSTLVELAERLFDSGVIPYYIHMLDRVRGAAHFEVPESRAVALQGGLRQRLPGYLVPRLVREVAGAPSKLPMDCLDPVLE